MDQTSLSKRLEAVAQYVPNKAFLADIGSDHGYLPTFLALRNRIQMAIAGEINEGPYFSAKKQVQSAGCEHIIDVRKGNGLSVVSANEVDTIVIAGMGGRLITDILEAGKDKLADNMRLILQPNIGADIVRMWLSQQQWVIIAESILEEDNKIYEVIVAEKSSEPVVLSDKGILFGPFLLKEKSDLFLKKWRYELMKWETIYKSLSHATETEETREKKNEFLQKIRIVKQVVQ